MTSSRWAVLIAMSALVALPVSAQEAAPEEPEQPADSEPAADTEPADVAAQPPADSAPEDSAPEDSPPMREPVIEMVAEPPPEPEVEPAPVDPTVEEARTRFRRGVELARNGDCRGAIAELEASVALVERPNTLFNIARCQEELFRYDLAVQAYERYQSIAPTDDPDRATVEATMRSLGMLLGTIVVSSNVPATVWIGDRQVGDSPGEVLIPGGNHALELRARGHLSERREVQVAGEQTVRVEFTLERAEMNVTNVDNSQTVNITEGGAPPGVFYGGLALTAIGAATAIALSATALSLSSEGDDIDPLDAAARMAQSDKINDRALLADIAWGVTGAFAVTTLVLFFLTDFDDDEEEPDATADEGVSVSVQAGFGSVGLAGQF